MEFLTSSGTLKKQWRRRKYHRLNGSATRKNVKIVKLGGNDQEEGKKKRAWKIRAIPKLRLIKSGSPLKLWTKFKNAYMNTMLRFAGNIEAMNNGNMFGGKRNSKARQVSLTYKKNEFENRLIYEVYKSLVVSMELHPK